jgi:hypothetical protein
VSVRQSSLLWPKRQRDLTSPADTWAAACSAFAALSSAAIHLGSTDLSYSATKAATLLAPGGSKPPLKSQQKSVSGWFYNTRENIHVLLMQLPIPSHRCRVATTSKRPRIQCRRDTMRKLSGGGSDAGGKQSMMINKTHH